MRYSPWIPRRRGGDRPVPPTSEEVYGRFDADLRAFVSARVGDPETADDVVQEVYL